MNAPQGEKDDPAARRDFLLEKYKNWAFGNPGNDFGDPPGQILRNDLVDRAPLKT
jgi:hypothetical protein